jgi:hypothetical protein
MTAIIKAVSQFIFGSFTPLGIFKAILGPVLSIGLTVGAGLLSKKSSKTGNAQDAGTRLTISQSAVDSHKIVYGRVRVSGTLVVSNSLDYAGVRNYLLFFYIVLAAHEIDGFEELWINSELATIAENGNITNIFLKSNGQYTIHIWRHLGLDNQHVDLTLTTPPMTSEFRMRGLAVSKFQLTFDRNAYPSGVPQFSETIRGRKLYDPRGFTRAVSGENTTGIITLEEAHGYSENESVWIISDDDRKAGEVKVNAVLGDYQLTLRDPYSGSEANITRQLGPGDKLSKMFWSDNWALVVRDYLTNPQW